MPARKPPAVDKVIHEAIRILEACGIPLGEKSRRQREKTAMAFLAVAGVTHSAGWSSAGDGAPIGTRKIITFINQHFQESISPGSYDDIRRKDLHELILARFVASSAGKPGASVNDPTRGYALSDDFRNLVRRFGMKGWQAEAAAFMSGRPSLADRLSLAGDLAAVPVELPGGVTLSLSSGPHNLLQKAVIEKFLPRYAEGSSVVYLGDTACKELYRDAELAASLGLSIDTSAKIPDIILFSGSKNWLFLIEAVHSFGPITNQRRMELRQFAGHCGAGLVFVTAFLDLNAFRKAAAVIGWDTEVWIAAEPGHLIHWNGDRFLGPRDE